MYTLHYIVMLISHQSGLSMLYVQVLVVHTTLVMCAGGGCTYTTLCRPTYVAVSVYILAPTSLFQYCSSSNNKHRGGYTKQTESRKSNVTVALQKLKTHNLLDMATLSCTQNIKRSGNSFCSLNKQLLLWQQQPRYQAAQAQLLEVNTSVSKLKNLSKLQLLHIGMLS